MPTTSPAVIYRYQPMRPDAIDLIRTGRLWFSDPLRFNDPFDFMPSFKDGESEIRRSLDWSREAARWTEFGGYSRSEFLKATEPQLNRLLREWRRAEQEKFRKGFARRFRVTCFSETKDDILMWSHYASGHSGVCFGIRPAQMRIAPEKALRWKVDCCDERLPFDSRHANRIVLRKAGVWKYEQEWRVVMEIDDLVSGKKPLARSRSAQRNPQFETGYFLKLQRDAIESVHFGALVDRRKRAAILKALKATELHHIQAIQMHLSVDRFALEEEVLQR